MYLIFNSRCASILMAFALISFSCSGHSSPSWYSLKHGIIVFPRYQPPKNIEDEKSMMQLFQGKLTLEKGCLRLKDITGSYLLIWPGWYSFSVDKRYIAITYTRLNKVVARFKLGDKVAIGGGAVPAQSERLILPIPRSCKGPYLSVGGIEVVKK